MTIAKTSFPYELESFSLADIVDSPILQFKDDVEEVGGFVVPVLVLCSQRTSCSSLPTIMKRNQRHL